MLKKSSGNFVSVFIPTYNGGPLVRDAIEAVFSQKLPGDYQLELIIIDSGSTDETVGIIQEYGDRINFIQIPNSEFGHGRTRQKAAMLAKGEFILFLSQDATPAHPEWLINMIEPFFVSDKVGAVFGRQIPRPYAVPTIKREVLGAFGGIGAPDSIVLHRYRSLVDSHDTNNINTFFSDVNSAVRKDLIKEIPFRDVKYAEDQALAEDLQRAGYLKAYTPIGAVWHSNEYSPGEYYHRKFDEYLGLIDSTDIVLTKSIKSLLLGWIRPSIDDLKFTLRDREYGPRTKIKFILTLPIYNINMQRGKFDAIKYSKDASAREKLSLEERRKRGD